MRTLPRSRVRQLCISSVVALLCAKTAVATVEPQQGWLKNSQIEELFRGSALNGTYASGQTFTERFLTDGRVEYIEGARAMPGRWSSMADTLCTIYDDDPAGGCFRVVKVDENCFEFYFVARTESATPGLHGAKPSWTARGSFDGRTGGCQTGASV